MYMEILRDVRGKVGLNVSNQWLAPPYNMDAWDVLEMYEEIGVDLVEVQAHTAGVFDDTGNVSTVGKKRFLDLLRAFEDTFEYIIHTPFPTFTPTYLAASDTERRDLAIGIVQESISLAVLSGAPLVVVHPSHEKIDLAAADEELLEQRIIMSILESARILEEIGMQTVIAVENMPPKTGVYRVGAGIRDLGEIVDKLRHSYTGVTLDTGHASLTMNQYGLSPREYLEGFANRVYHVHLQDNYGEYDDHLPPGYGTAPLSEILSVLDQAEYPGGFIVETGPKEYCGLADCKDPIDFLPTILDRARSLVKAHIRGA